MINAAQIPAPLIEVEANDTATDTRIYVACLAAYNSGILHGAWIDIDDDTTKESLQEAINAVLASSPEPGAEEWAIHDYDGLPSSLGENPDLESVLTVAEATREHGSVFAAFMDQTGYDAEEAAANFADQYSGAWDNREAFGQNLWEELGYDSEIPEHLRAYIDTDRFTNDLFLGGDYFDIQHEHQTHVFSSR